MKFGLYFSFLLKPMTGQMSWFFRSHCIKDFDRSLKFKITPVKKDVRKYIVLSTGNTAGTYIEKLSS